MIAIFYLNFSANNMRSNLKLLINNPLLQLFGKGKLSLKYNNSNNKNNNNGYYLSSSFGRKILLFWANNKFIVNKILEVN